MHENLILFDLECPFCHRAVEKVLELDVDNRFLFAPLNGKTALDVLSGPQKQLIHVNGLVVVEKYLSTERQFWTRFRGAFRVYWLIGNHWSLFGLISFLPSWSGDWLYRLFAEHRHQFKLPMPPAAIPKDRFLP